MQSNLSFLVPIMQCVASILQRISIRSLGSNIRLNSGKLLVWSQELTLILLFKPEKEMHLRLKSIYLQLAMRTLPLLIFHDLDLAMIHLILLNQLIQYGERSENFHLFNFLMGYMSGFLLPGIKEDKHSYLLGTQSFQMQLIRGINTARNLRGVSGSFLHLILTF